MSYSRQYRETVSKEITVTCSYPKSESGGSISKSVTVDIPVEVNIHVDTKPFDRSVAGCNNTVNVLTGAVAATEAAQVASIDKNSKKVAGTIVDGFFDYIRKGISEQKTELEQQINANLIYLHGMVESINKLQERMEDDYNKLWNRYTDSFNGWDKELENRIFELDKPAFVFKKNSDKHALRTSENDLVSTVTVFGLEGGELQAKISASIAKKRAFDTITKANIFLMKQKKVQSTINQSMLKESVAAVRYSPVCFMETNGEKSQMGRNVYQADFLPKMNPEMLVEKFQTQQWAATTKESKENIRRYFNSEVINTYNSGNPHDNRIKEMIVKIFDANSIKSI